MSGATQEGAPKIHKYTSLLDIAEVHAQAYVLCRATGLQGNTEFEDLTQMYPVHVVFSSFFLEISVKFKMFYRHVGQVDKY